MSRYAARGIVVSVFIRSVSGGARGDRGQASVELLGALPAVLLVGALVWQMAVVGQAVWLSAGAARAAARAEAVGRDGEQAARRALPRSLARGLRVEPARDGAVRVRLRVPLLVRAWRSPLSVAATARLVEGSP